MVEFKTDPCLLDPCVVYGKDGWVSCIFKDQRRTNVG
jgi:hypothetical protein